MPIIIEIIDTNGLARSNDAEKKDTNIPVQIKEMVPSIENSVGLFHGKVNSIGQLFASFSEPAQVMLTICTNLSSEPYRVSLKYEVALVYRNKLLFI